MAHKEEIEKAKKYMSQQGYGTGTNYTMNVVASLMVEWSRIKVNNLDKAEVIKSFFSE